MAGGWEQAARLPIIDGLTIAQDRLKAESREMLRHAQVCWHSALPIYANGGDPPDPPELDEDED